MALHPQLQNIRQKLQLLVKQQAGAQKELRHLQEENNRLKETLAESELEISRLAEKFTALNISGMPQTSEARKDLEKRINTYLKEIDKCLEIINT